MRRKVTLGVIKGQSLSIDSQLILIRMSRRGRICCGTHMINAYDKKKKKKEEEN